MTNPDSLYLPKPPTAKTVRELNMARLLREALPYLAREELSTRTSPVLRDLIKEIREELG